MNQYIQKASVIDYTNSTENKIDYGDIVVIGTRIGIAAEDIAAGAVGGLKVEGAFEVPAVNNEAFAVGDIIYLDAAGKGTKTKGILTVIMGWAIAPKATEGATALIKLCDNSYVQEPFVPTPMFIPGQRFTVTYPQVAAADVAKTFWIAPAPCKIISAQERHVTVSAAACKLQIEKLATGEAPGAGDELLKTGFDLTSTANTPVEDLADEAAVDLIAGDALALKVGSGDAASYALGTITVTMEWVEVEEE